MPVVIVTIQQAYLVYSINVVGQEKHFLVLSNIKEFLILKPMRRQYKLSKFAFFLTISLIFGHLSVDFEPNITDQNNV